MNLKELIRANAQSVHIARTFSNLDRIAQMLGERIEIMRVAQVLKYCAYQVLKQNMSVNTSRETILINSFRDMEEKEGIYKNFEY